MKHKFKLLQKERRNSVLNANSGLRHTSRGNILKVIWKSCVNKIIRLYYALAENFSIFCNVSFTHVRIFDRSFNKKLPHIKKKFFNMNRTTEFCPFFVSPFLHSTSLSDFLKEQEAFRWIKELCG